MTLIWLFFLQSAALCVNSHPQDLHGLAEAATESKSFGPIVGQVSSGTPREPAGKAWGMGSLTVLLPAERSWLGSRLARRDGEASVAGDDPDGTDGPAGTLLLPIEHREMPGLAKRDGEFRTLSETLQPRSDIAYYTTRT